MATVMIDHLKTLVRSDQQVSADLEDQVIVLSAAEGQYYALEGVGARVWNLLEEPHTVPSLIDRLLQEYEIDETQCREDVVSFLRTLSEAGLIVEAPGGARLA